MSHTNKILTYLFDIGGLGTKWIVVDDAANIIKKGHINYDETKRIMPMMQWDLKYLLGLIAKQLNHTETFNLGISLPGVVDDQNHCLITDSSITNITDVNIKAFFKDFKIHQFKVENDGKAAAYGEYCFGQHKKYKNMMHITIGTGLGGGIILNDQIYKGASLAAGEISKIFSNFENDRFAFGAQYLSIGSILSIYHESKKIGRLAQINDMFTMPSSDDTNAFKADGYQFMEAVITGDKIATQVFDWWINGLAKFIVSINALMDFEIITIGGGVSSNPLFIKSLMHKIIEIIEVFKKFSKNETINVQKAHLENDAGCLGMFAQMFDK